MRSVSRLIPRTIPVVCAIAAILLTSGFGCSAGAPFFAFGEVEKFEWSGGIAPGKTIEIKGINGAIEAEPARGSTVEVSAVKRGRRHDPKEVEIKVVEHGGGVTICAVYPSPDGIPNECAPGEHGRMNTRNNDVDVKFTVRVPSGVRFVGRTVNGGISSASLESEVEGHTVNGSINISGTSMAQAGTVNGGIAVDLRGGPLKQALAFRTVNGSINVALPQDINADLEVSTINGSINTDFPVTIQGHVHPKHLRGKLGSGGPRLELNTVNGGISLRRSS